MKISSMILLLFLLLFMLSQPSHPMTILVDGVSEWKNPNVHVGDTIIFKHKYQFKLYIFQNLRAFNVCNFTQASLLTKPNSTSYTWYPSRPGFYYFGFNNGSHNSCNQDSQKLFIKVSPQAPPPLPASQFPPTPTPTPTPIPPPISGGEVSSSPAYPWPFHPREAASSPAPEPSSGTSSPLTVPTVVPDKGGGIPFINSNPAVPLPTDEVDSATIRPLPASGHHHQVAVGLLGVHMTLLCVILLLPL